jgi:hypothetical protein
MTGTFKNESSPQAKKEADEMLSEALEQTFPCSDPVAENQVDEGPVRPVDRRPALIDKALVNELAKSIETSHAQTPQKR